MRFDYVIIGAGVIGSSTAYHLKKSLPDKQILLIDMNFRAGAGNTAKSAALYRNIFSSHTSRILASSSIKYYENLDTKISLKPIGYLWLFSKKQWFDSHTAIQQLDPKNDNFEILTKKDVCDILELNPEKNESFQDVYSAIYGYSCGALSAMALAQYYASEFEKIGGATQFRTKITSFDLTGQEYCYAPWSDVKISSIKDRNGNNYPASHFIAATGAWTHDFLAPIGISSGILPKKRQLFGLKVPDASQMLRDLDSSKMPAIILPAGGVYIKPILENNLLVTGCADELGQPFRMSNPEPDIDYFHRAIEPVLTHYFPKLTDYELALKWAGYYAYYWPDKNPVIETVSNLTWVSGTSGSGIMKADAIGRIAAAKVQGLNKVTLFDGTSFKVSKLSLRSRSVEKESFIL
ncbi:MAG: NAD(P)/FAD-dependent oxidoreductase [Candidatus Hodarchaeota archaeon]